MNKTLDLTTIQILKRVNPSISSLRHLICNTTLGMLELNIRKEEPEYFFTLDSVPLPKDLNKELLKLYNV